MKIKLDPAKFGLWVTVMAFFASILFFLYPITLGKNRPNLTFITLSSSRIFTLNEDLSGLVVTYRDIDLNQSHQIITVYVIRVTNNGNAPILETYFDNDIYYGIELTEGKLISRPELISTSDSSYFINVVKYFDEHTVTFEKCIINPEQYFDVKLMVLHDKNKAPDYKGFGAIAFQNKIEVSALNIESENSIYSWKYLIYIMMGFIIGFLSAILMHYYLCRIEGKEFKYNSLIKEIALSIKKLHKPKTNSIHSKDDSDLLSES